MVGVPRSGGCHNCRRKRKKCDEQKPACKRCTDSGNVCEGYERYATYVNRTVNGLQKRKRLEEAVVRENSSMSPDFSSTGSPSSSTYIAPNFDDVVFEQFPVSPPEIHDAQAVYYQTLFAEFLDLYQPKDPQNQTGSTLYWIKDSIVNYDSLSPALSASLRAFATSIVAESRKDPELKNTARRLYGKALQELKTLLVKSPPSTDDHTIAAARCAMIKEIYDATSGSVAGWNSHEQGLAHLARIRGPQSFVTPYQQALLADIKRTNMIATLPRNQKSLLGQPKWRLNKYPETLADIEQMFIDLAFEIGATCAEDEEEKKDYASGVIDRDRQLALLDTYLGLQQRNEDLVLEMKRLKPADVVPISVDFWNFESACHLAELCAIHMKTGRFMEAVYERFTENNTPPPGTEIMLGQIKARTGREHFLETAQRAVAALTYMSSDEMGLFGAQRCILPCRMSSGFMPQESLAYRQAIDLYRSLSKRSVQHGDTLNKEYGDITHFGRQNR